METSGDFYVLLFEPYPEAVKGPPDQAGKFGG